MKLKSPNVTDPGHGALGLLASPVSPQVWPLQPGELVLRRGDRSDRSASVASRKAAHDQTSSHWAFLAERTTWYF
jgi:hypothetical protein